MEVIKNYLTQEECAAIIASLDRVEERHWAAIYVSDNVYVNRPMKVFAYKRYCGNILDRLNLDYTTSVEVLKYPEGTNLPVHVDTMGSYTDSSLKTKTAPWLHARQVLLNDEFDGGELIFPNLGLTYGKESKGSLIEFPGGVAKYAHGVNPVRNGTRYSLVIRD